MIQGDFLSVLDESLEEKIGSRPCDGKPNMVKIRAELYGALNEARAASEIPWRTEMLRYYRGVFPQMSNWLPADERAQLLVDFNTELKRLGGDI